MRLEMLAAVLCCLVLARPSVTRAGTPEQLFQIGLHPSDPNTIVLRYQFGGDGLLLTHDRGATWSLLCNSFIDPTTSGRTGNLAVNGDGSIQLSVFEGVWKGDKNGCGWALDPGVGPRWIATTAHDPNDSQVLFAGTANGGDGVTNAVLKRSADGQWTQVGVEDEIMILGLRVVSTGTGLRMVETATRGNVPRTIDGVDKLVPNYLVRVSDDEGESWQEFPFEAEGTNQFLVENIDPSNPDRMLAYVEGDETLDQPVKLLVSVDGGQSFSDYAEITTYGGSVILPDGRVMIGDRGSNLPMKGSGLWSAASLAEAPKQLGSDYRVGCLAYQAETETLFGCDLTGFGIVDLDTGALERLMKVDQVQSIVECDGVDVVKACQPQFCGAYCMLGHFPSTPACEVYQTSACGPCAALPPGPGCTLYADAGPSAQDGGAARDAGTMMPSENGDTDRAKPGSNGGCACAAAGGHHVGHALPALGALALGSALARRRLRV